MQRRIFLVAFEQTFAELACGREFTFLKKRQSIFQSSVERFRTFVVMLQTIALSLKDRTLSA